MQKPASLTWREAFLSYTRPRVLVMLFLGFSAGLPYLLVFTTLSLWLREADVTRTTIGFFSWIGITYSIKVFWAPVIDRLPFPLLTASMGKRRSWMLLAQLTIAMGLIGMAVNDPEQGLTVLALFGLVVAFGSATQDITIDAYRIEAMDKVYQGSMAASYVAGYRVALIVAGAGAIYIADAASWQTAYLTMALLMAVGIITVLLIEEPEHKKSVATEQLEKQLADNLGLGNDSSVLVKSGKWFSDAVLAPVIDFFKRNGWLAFIILLLIGSYRISDITMGVMTKPFYYDSGFSKKEIATIAGVFGVLVTMLGSFTGGVIVARFGVLKPLLIGALLVPLTNLFFVWLAITEPTTNKLVLVLIADNLSGGFASIAFIAYLSSLTNTTYTATQYALFSSLMTLPGKLIGGFAGVVVDALEYAWFFFYAGCIGIPAIALVLYLLAKERQTLAGQA